MVSFRKFTTTFGAAALLSSNLVHAGQAPLIEDNPSNAVYRADIDNDLVHGIVDVYTARNGRAKVKVDITGIPETGGPFWYHIHENKVPNGKECEAAGTHFNPYGAPPDCDSQHDDSYCQVGDLSGKHGFINTTCFQLVYYDPYLSLDPASESFIGDRSVVVHYNDLTKLACGNFHKHHKGLWRREDDEDLVYESFGRADYSLDEDAELDEDTELDGFEGKAADPEAAADSPQIIEAPVNSTTNSSSTSTDDNSEDDEIAISTTYEDGAVRQVSAGVVAALLGLAASLL